MKDNFLLKKSQQEVFRELSDIDAGKLIKGIFNYVNTGDSELDGYLKVVFIPIKDCIDKNEETYRKRCEINKLNGSKGGAPKGNNNAKKEKQPKTTERLQKQPKTSKNNMNNHIHIHNNHLEEKKDNNRGMGEEEEKEETFKNAKKVHFAEFVTMTNAEYDKLVSTYGKKFADQCIKTLDNYKGSSGKKYRSDYRAILSWVVDKVKKDVSKDVVPEWFNEEQDVEKVSDNNLDELDKILEEIGVANET